MDNGAKRIEGTAAIRVLPKTFGWNPIETAPSDEDVSLEVTDGQGAPYRLPYRCGLTTAGRISSSKGTPLAVTPGKWKSLPAAVEAVTSRRSAPRTDKILGES
jgi:hypothetical protein